SLNLRIKLTLDLSAKFISHAIQPSPVIGSILTGALQLILRPLRQLVDTIKLAHVNATIVIRRLRSLSRFRSLIAGVIRHYLYLLGNEHTSARLVIRTVKQLTVDWSHPHRPEGYAEASAFPSGSTCNPSFQTVDVRADRFSSLPSPVPRSDNPNAYTQEPQCKCSRDAIASSSRACTHRQAAHPRPDYARYGPTAHLLIDYRP